MVYATVFAAVIFYYKEPGHSNYAKKHPVERFYGKNTSQDRVVLLEEKKFSALARINLIENAQESIDVAYYAIHKGYISDLLIGMILDAADRGVKVRVLLDGIFHNLRGEYKGILYAFIGHPNIEIRYYEPFKPLKPWTWNNRFHDKLLMVDSKYAIIGGRNIGNRYFIQEGDKAPTSDRDVLIMNTDLQNAATSVIAEMEGYFDEVWKHPYTVNPVKKLSSSQYEKGVEKSRQLKDKFHQLQDLDPKLFHRNYDWMKLSVPTKNITFLHNPLQRFNKEPWIWEELNNLMASAKKSIVIQSPYIIPTKQMRKFEGELGVGNEKVTILTNSLASTANVIAFSGYIRHRDELIKRGFHVLEYQGPDSLHAKTFMFDDRLSVVGAFNMDSRSTFLNTESMVVIDSIEFANVLGKELEYYFDKSLEVTKGGGYWKGTNVDEGEFSFVKSAGVKVLSYVTMLFQHLL
ncbi:phospholipase D-like domain-containing protein [Pseudoneobacillus sp. C159]